MATVAEFLEDTMLAAAARGNTNDVLIACDDPSRLSVLPEPPSKPGNGINDEDAPIWNWSAPTIGGGVHLKDLTCRVSGMNYMTMGVCDSIDWGPVTFTSEHSPGPITLPLENAYVLRWRSAREGAISGKDQYWKLQSKTDQSFEVIFGYEFPNPEKIGVPHPMPGDLSNFFGPRDSDPSSNHVSVFQPHSTQSNTLRVTPLRILVVVTLICCKQRFNFDPLGSLGVGRFYPMIMAVSNHELNTVAGKIRIARPRQIKMMPDAEEADGMPCHSGPANSTVFMDGEEMTSNLGAMFFTDSNASHLPPPSAAWNVLFDYYDVNPQPGAYVLSVPWKNQGNRQPAGAQVTRTATWNESGMPKKKQDLPWEQPKKLTGPGAVSTRYDISKMAGQGEFDNIHVAPRMVIRPENVVCSESIKRNLSGLDNIAMAPVCIHDCMHLHVRWGADNGAIQSRGWSDELSPNSMAGAPLVPPNQKVTVNLLTATSFEYLAEAQGVKAGRWQIMLHHGAAYALSIGAMANIGRLMANHTGFSVAERPATSSSPAWTGQWALMYWNLRWLVGIDDLQYERVTWPAGSLPQLREAGSLSAGQTTAAGAH